MDASPSPTIEISRSAPDTHGRPTADFTYDSGEDWGATGQLVRTRKGIVISELTVTGFTEADKEPKPITSGVLRSVPTGEIVAAALESGFLAHPEAAPATPRSSKPQPGRQPLSEELMRSVAEAYLAETAPGKPRGAIKRLAEQFGKPGPTISRWVMRAREDGWLGPAVPGREGATPGRRLLEEWDAERDPSDREAARHFFKGVADHAEAMFTTPKPTEPDGE